MRVRQDALEALNQTFRGEGIPHLGELAWKSAVIDPTSVAGVALLLPCSFGINAPLKTDPTKPPVAGDPRKVARVLFV